MGTRFLWDSIEDNIVKELDDSNTTVADYTTEPYLYGDLISQDRIGQSRFYHFDGQGSTMELTDSSGNVTDIRRYSAFGETTQDTGSTTFPFQYNGQTGYYFYGSAGQHHVRMRNYIPAQSRWSSIDLLWQNSDINLFKYCNNAPTIFIDPSGLDCKVCWAVHNTSETTLDQLDAHAKEGKPYTTAMNAFLVGVTRKYADDIPITRATIPTIIRVGPGIVYNRVSLALPIERAYAIAYWARFVSITVCEDNPGDCEVAVFETWKEEEHAIPDPDRKGWQDVTEAGKKARHAAIARLTPPVFPGSDASILNFEPKDKPCGCCRERVIILADIPSLDAHLKPFGDVIVKAFGRRLSIRQENLVFKKGGETPIFNAEASWTLGVNTDGSLVTR